MRREVPQHTRGTGYNLALLQAHNIKALKHPALSLPDGAFTADNIYERQEAGNKRATPTDPGEWQSEQASKRACERESERARESEREGEKGRKTERKR